MTALHSTYVPSGTNSFLEDSCNGVVKSFNVSKGFGFVTIQSQADDVYFKTEDLTPRSKQRVQRVSGITGASITCTPEIFGEGRARARCISCVDQAKQLSVVTASATMKTAVLEDPSLKVAPTISMAALRLPSAKKAASGRPRIWGTASDEEVSRQKTELMAMGFAEDVVDDALSRGLEFNIVLDALLSGEGLPSLPPRKESIHSLQTTGSASELESCLTDAGRLSTRAGSDDSSDNTSACGSADKSQEVLEPEFGLPDMDTSSPKADSEIALGCDAVTITSEEFDFPSDLSAALQGCAEVPPCPAEAPPECPQQVTNVAIKTETAGASRQLARVLSALPTESSDTNLLSVHQGTLIYVWPHSATEHGWIYAERLDKTLAGWIPTDLLKLLSPSLEWRSAAQKHRSFSDLHLAAEHGDIILVDSESMEQAAEGAWIHAERLDGTKAGWFPNCALAEISETQQWVRVVDSQVAVHNSQATVVEGDSLLVDLETRTKEGWAYAWAADRHHDSVQAGWVPVNCLEWPQ